jgi:thiamine-monophosphate kinase
VEKGFITWVKLQAEKLPKVALGIGDDAAILEPAAGFPEVVTCDSLCDGTHFILSECGPRAVGRKLAAVNLSDIAAMGAEPTAFFLSYCLPRDGALEIAQELTAGVIELSTQFGVALAGGDTNVWAGPLVVHATLIGHVKDGNPWRRDQAQVGDLIVVSGELGGSILGKHLSFTPRLELARKLREVVNVRAACDMSDGLASDLLNICAASKCGAELYLNKIPVSQSAYEISQKDGKPPVDHALSDGEDFEMLFTIAKSDRGKLPQSIDGIPLSIVGEIVSRTGLWNRVSGKLLPLKVSGYQHK